MWTTRHKEGHVSGMTITKLLVVAVGIISVAEVVDLARSSVQSWPLWCHDGA